MNRPTLTCLLLLLGCVIILLIGKSTAQEPKLGDESDGNRAVPVHRINLYDETNALIRPDDRVPMPFSTKETCQQECHDYSRIHDGWHFNAGNPEIPAGRRGEPWILADQVTATQVPLSYRRWAGAFKPEDFGITPFSFTETFGRHNPGGGTSENDSTESPDIFMRWRISGKAEINCLACHDGEAAHDQAEYHRQMQFQNFRWAAAATSGFAAISGAARNMPINYDIYSGIVNDIQNARAPKIEYDKNRFDSQGKVFFDIRRNVPNERCYFCHSSKYTGNGDEERWHGDEDVHIAAGLSCTDCHRNALNHMISRGYEGEAEERKDAMVATLSCRGCHVREYADALPANGRLGAPYPEHKGLPPIHFDKLSCTACHSGPLPQNEIGRVKLSRAHALGTHGVKKGDDVVPYIYSPVYALGEDGKITPQRLMWPSFWAFTDGDALNPIDPKKFQKMVLNVFHEDSLTDSTNIALMIAGNWADFPKTRFSRILDSLKILFPESGAPVYVAGGKVFGMENGGEIVGKQHPAAAPYMWPFAHDVRPAEQSLGVRSCEDCHSAGAAFTFASVKAETPLGFAAGEELEFSSLQGMDAVYPRVFAFTFLFRPFLKNLIILCSLLIVLVFVYGSVRCMESLLRSWSGEN